ncbi:MAG: hypothetical protein NTV79_01660 [Candidatus Aureabacteria bacterium]|nr:hypothetical protein [Candidatus Auribacterota bacterium]
MENPKEVARLLLAMLVVFIVAIVLSSILLGDYHILLWGIAAIVIISLLCALNSMVNVVVFGPLLWLASKVLSRESKGKAPPNERRARPGEGSADINS